MVEHCETAHHEALRHPTVAVMTIMAHLKDYETHLDADEHVTGLVLSFTEWLWENACRDCLETMKQFALPKEPGKLAEMDDAERSEALSLVVMLVAFLSMVFNMRITTQLEQQLRGMRSPSVEELN